MYQVDIFHFSWGWQPTVVRLVLLTQFVLVFLSGLRFMKSARRLYRYSGERILPEHVLMGETDPDLLAESSLAGRLPCRPVLEKRANPESFSAGTGAEKTLHILREAEAKFRYLWEGCHADVESAKRASLLTFLLSLVMVAYAASPIYFECWNDSNLTGSTCLFRTVWHLLVLLALGWSCSAMLYFAASFFERKLARRKTCWTYFCSRLRNGMVC